MPFTNADIRKKIHNEDGAISNAYTIPATDYVAGKLYILACSAEDNTMASPGNAIPDSVTTSAGVWEVIAIQDYQAVNGLIAYSMVADVTGSFDTEVVYPVDQLFMDSWVVEIDSANLTTPIVQTVDDNLGDIDYIISLSNPITDDNLAITLMATDGVVVDWTLDSANQESLNDSLSVRGLCMYTINPIADMTATIATDRPGLGISFEVAYGAAQQLLISDVNGGLPIAHNDKDVLVSGVGFLAAGAKSYLISNNDFSNPSKVLQTNNSQTDTQLSIDINYGGVEFLATGYLFVETSALDVTAGFAVPMVVPETFECSAVIKDSAGDAAICNSTDFALGMTGIKNLGLPNEETALTVVSLSNADTSLPRYDVTMTTGKPVDGADTFDIIYDPAVGNIRSVQGNKAMPAATLAATVCP